MAVETILGSKGVWLIERLREPLPTLSRGRMGPECQIYGVIAVLGGSIKKGCKEGENMLTAMFLRKG